MAIALPVSSPGNISAREPNRQRPIPIELAVRKIRREQQHPRFTPNMPQRRSRFPKSSGASNGCNVSRTPRSAHDIRRRPVHPRRVGTQAAPNLVGAPQKRRQPGGPRTPATPLSAPGTGEHALGDERQQLAVERLRLSRIVLDDIRRPARRGRRMPEHPARMDAHRQPVPLRPPDTPASKTGDQAACRSSPAPAPAQTDHQPRTGRSPTRRGGGLHRYGNRGEQARFGVQPFGAYPVVDGTAEGGGHVLAVSTISIQHCAIAARRPKTMTMRAHRRQVAVTRTARTLGG